MTRKSFVKIVKQEKRIKRRAKAQQAEFGTKKRG